MLPIECPLSPRAWSLIFTPDALGLVGKIVISVICVTRGHLWAQVGAQKIPIRCKTPGSPRSENFVDSLSVFSYFFTTKKKSVED